MASPSVVLTDLSKDSADSPRLVDVARALQTQVDRDFAPVWGATARVLLRDQPAPRAPTWTISVVDEPAAVLGIWQDRVGTLRAQVPAGRHWSFGASHVLLEMLANPTGERVIDGADVWSRTPGRRVQYLVDVCDPCQVLRYQIDGIVVSDFVTPDYYDEGPADGVAFDFLRRLSKPLQVGQGCYLSWRDPEDGRWHQRDPDGMLSSGPAHGSGASRPRNGRGHAPSDDLRRHDVWRTARQRGGLK